MAKAKKPRSLNAGTGAVEGGGAPFNEQDPKRRLGNFEGSGEAPRKGSRTAGIIGQTKQKFHNDKKKA